MQCWSAPHEKTMKLGFLSQDHLNRFRCGFFTRMIRRDINRVTEVEKWGSAVFITNLEVKNMSKVTCL